VCRKIKIDNDVACRFHDKIIFCSAIYPQYQCQNIYDKTNVKRKVYRAHKYVVNNDEWKDQETFEGQKKSYT